MVFEKGGNRRLMQRPSPKAKTSAFAPRMTFALHFSKKMASRALWKVVFLGAAVHDHHRGVFESLEHATIRPSTQIHRVNGERHLQPPHPSMVPDFSVVSFRPGFMRVSEGYPMKAHKNQWFWRRSHALKVPYRALPGFQITLCEGQNPLYRPGVLPLPRRIYL